MKSRRTFSCRTAALALGVLLSSGCATQYRFHVDAVRAPLDVEAHESFRVVNANPDVRDDDPRFRQTAELVTTALSSKGLYEAPAGVEPDMTVEIDFGVEDTGRVVEYTVWEPGPGSAPETKTVSSTVFEKFVRITARESAAETPAPAPRELWSVLVTNEDTSNRLPDYVPLLVSAGMDSIGEADDEGSTVVLTRDDARVLFVTQGM